jgi:hypothetical protein
MLVFVIGWAYAVVVAVVLVMSILHVLYVVWSGASLYIYDAYVRGRGADPGALSPAACLSAHLYFLHALRVCHEAGVPAPGSDHVL